MAGPARDRMFAGEHINVTEDRAVLHTALQVSRPTLTVDADAIADARGGQVAPTASPGPRPLWRVGVGKPVKTVVNVKYRRSDLRPRYGVRGP